MRRITEQEAVATVGPSEPPLLAKSENEVTESAVTLKQWPSWFVLGISCDLDDRFELYAIDDSETAWSEYESHVARMAQTGRPFFDGG